MLSRGNCLRFFKACFLLYAKGICSIISGIVADATKLMDVCQGYCWQ